MTKAQQSFETVKKNIVKLNNTQTKQLCIIQENRG